MKRGSNDQSVFEALKEWLASHPKKHRYDQSLIEKAWKEQMGSTIDNQTEYIKFKNGVVSLKIRSSALKQELHMGKEKIIKILRETLPEVMIEEVRIY